MMGMLKWTFSAATLKKLVIYLFVSCHEPLHDVCKTHTHSHMLQRHSLGVASSAVDESVAVFLLQS